MPPLCHILLVEDDPDVAELLAAALRAAGFRNLSLSSSIAGARQCWHAQFGKFDVLVADFSLPDGCATDFIPELLRHNPSLSVILMSGFREDALDLEDLPMKHVNVLQKPFPPSELIDVVTATASTETTP